MTLKSSTIGTCITFPYLNFKGSIKSTLDKNSPIGIGLNMLCGCKPAWNKLVEKLKFHFSLQIFKLKNKTTFAPTFYCKSKKSDRFARFSPFLLKNICPSPVSIK